ncbi:MAG: class I SAM-dependent methyltransferase [Bacteriovoracaceae bacterium]|nr:class I SAM-dependent methyltransferase [Bacteriovoracaceae bacterium]
MATLDGVKFNWKDHKMVNVLCPLCDSSDYKVYEQYGEEYQYSNVKCSKCKFIYQNPRFEYNETFLKWAYDSYGDSYIELTNKTDEIRESFENPSGYFKFKKQIIDDLCTKEQYTLLDVGCACGQFIYFCKGQKNCIPSGVEVSAPQVQFATEKLGLDVHCGTLQQAGIKDESFDVVHCAHTLEHIPTPKEMIKELVRVLKPGGFLFIEVPNVYSKQNYMKHLLNKRRLIKNSWQAGDFPEHLMEYAPKTIQKLLQDHQLEIKYFQVHSRSAMNKGPVIKKLDLFINKMIPFNSNMICVGQKLDKK